MISIGNSLFIFLAIDRFKNIGSPFLLVHPAVWFRRFSIVICFTLSSFILENSSWFKIPLIPKIVSVKLILPSSTNFMIAVAVISFDTLANLNKCLGSTLILFSWSA